MRNALSLVLVVMAVAALFLGLATGNRSALSAAQAQARLLASQRDSLLRDIARRERERASLTVQRDSLAAESGVLRDSVTALERARSAAQLSVREIRTTGALQARLRSAFPELGKTGWGLTTVPVQKGDTVGIQYLLVPAWFGETFIINRLNAKSWLAQRDRLLQIDSLQAAVTQLQDSVTTLATLNAAAYRSGYEAAYAGYQETSRKYVAELKKPRIGFGSTLGVLAVAGAGCFVGQALQ